MTFKSYREGSRENYGNSQGDHFTLEQLQTGALLRIADATEAMAQYHVQIIRDRDRFEKYWRNAQDGNARRDRQIAALRGVITRMKRRAQA